MLDLLCLSWKRSYRQADEARVASPFGTQSPLVDMLSVHKARSYRCWQTIQISQSCTHQTIAAGAGIFRALSVASQRNCYNLRILSAKTERVHDAAKDFTL